MAGGGVMSETRAIDAIKIGQRHRKDLGDVWELAHSIDAVGLLHPIVITPDGELIAGQRRLEACKLLGWQEIPVRIIDLDDIEQGECDENGQREDYRLSEKVDVWRSLESRQGQKQLPLNFNGGEEPRIRAARITGTSTVTLSRAKQIVEAAEAEPEKFAPLVEEMDKTGRVNGVYKKLKTAQQAEEIKQEPPPLPAGPFRVIVIDPPWSYENRASDSSHRAANPYPSMPLDDIKAIPVGGLAGDDCIL